MYAPNEEKCRKDFIKKSERCIKMYALKKMQLAETGIAAGMTAIEKHYPIQTILVECV